MRRPLPAIVARSPERVADLLDIRFIDPRPPCTPAVVGLAELPAISRQVAADRDIRIGGGPSTIREFLAAGLIDYMHIVVVPIVLGRGERLWDGLEALEDRFQIEAVNSPSGVSHITFSRR